MRYNVLTYLIGEGLSNVFRNSKQAFTSIGTMCLTMLIFGIFFVIGQNINNMVEQIEMKQGLRVFMEVDATDAQIERLKQELNAIDGINTVEYKSKEEALQYIKDKLGPERTAGYDESKEKIFSVSYVVTLTDLSLSRNIQKKIETLDGVRRVTSADEAIDALVRLAKGIRIGTYVILISLIVFAIFIISNTIKLTVHARRREISIMKYVGATNGFIRWPFAVEGMLIGIIAGAISIGILAGVYSLIVRWQGLISFLSNLGLKLLEFSEMIDLILVVYLVLGIVIGALGSTISMRKYLKV